MRSPEQLISYAIHEKITPEMLGQLAYSEKLYYRARFVGVSDQQWTTHQEIVGQLATRSLFQNSIVIRAGAELLCHNVEAGQPVFPQDVVQWVNGLFSQITGYSIQQTSDPVKQAIFVDWVKAAGTLWGNRQEDFQ